MPSRARPSRPRGRPRGRRAVCGLGFREVWGLGGRVSGVGCNGDAVLFAVWGLGFGVQGVGCRVYRYVIVTCGVLG